MFQQFCVLLSWQNHSQSIHFLSVISNVSAPAELIMIQFDDHVRMRLISKLIKEIWRFVQKLLKYFDGTAISTPSVLPSPGIFPVIFTLVLNDSQSVKVIFGSSL